MTVDLDDEQRDDCAAALAGLRTFDVSQRRSRQLRRRCHAILENAPPPGRPVLVNRMLLRRIVGPALGGAWCVAYLVEIGRRAAAVYFGTQ